MRKLLNIVALSGLLLVPAASAHAQVTFDFHIGAPPAPRAYRVPPRPGPEYVWVEGYWYPAAGHYRWHDGYWTRPPYEGAYWVAPYHVSGQYFAGHWEGDRGRIDHDHRWDRSHDRDDHRGRGREDRR